MTNINQSKPAKTLPLYNWPAPGMIRLKSAAIPGFHCCCGFKGWPQEGHEAASLDTFFIPGFSKYLVPILIDEFGEWIGFGAGNEVHAGQGWHNIQRDIILDIDPDFPRERMITSMCIKSFYRKHIFVDWTYSVHGCNPETYDEQMEILPSNQKAQRCIVSQDGCHPTKTAKEIEDFTFKILQDGRVGIEQQIRPHVEKKNGKWDSVFDKADWSLRTLNFAYAEAIKKGWFRYLK
jgi:hypothetical protein